MSPLQNCVFIGEKMSISVVIDTLKELSNWLSGSPINQEKVNEIIRKLERSDITASELKEIKFQLSAKMMFHPKWLGDVYVPGFVGDGTGWAWYHYLDQVAKVCQSNL